MRTLLETLNLAEGYLSKKGIDQARRQAQDLFCDALGLDRMQLYQQHDRPLDVAELELLRARLARRANGEPTAYIHGEVRFYDCILKVNKDVLIPRQETEILADKIAKDLEGVALEGKTMWDLGCGSGCLGIALKKKYPQLNVVLSDVCPLALEVARENALKNGVAAEFLLGDFLHPFRGRTTDFLVSNPPYITEVEYDKLDREVKDHEPRRALVAGAKGLDFYERFATEISPFLNRNAKLWFEVGSGQGNAVMALFDNGSWKSRRIEKDWAGHDRFFFLEIE